MKKLLITFFVLALCLTVSLTASAMNLTKFTSTGDDYGFTFEIKGDELIVSGCVQNEDIFYLMIATNQNYIVNIAPESTFTTGGLKLPADQTKRIDLNIYVGTKITDPFTGVFFGDDIVIEKIEDAWYFTFDDSVYNSNKLALDGWIYPEENIKAQPNAVKMVTASVIQGIEGDYKKAEAIHRWLADNIYYDKDYALNTKTTTSLTPVEVLTSRVSVCEGYSNLAVSMLNSAGIPAVTVRGYSLDNVTASTWSEATKTYVANHMWVEAYVDGRWVIMDPTWDSKNMYYRGKKETVAPVVYRYFDITPEMLSAKHKIVHRPTVFSTNGISEWAEEEAKEAYKLGLITPEIIKTLTGKINREEFCNLVVNLLSKKLNKPIETILSDKKLTLNYEFFNDTSSYNILAANALGIVNGKGEGRFDPRGYITRQEAAVMLQRTAKVLGVTSANGEKLTFADADSFPDWSADAIAFVSASATKEGVRVMGGVGNDRFSPTGNYTKEQSVLTIYRLFWAY